MWAEADVTGHAGHRVRLTVTGADGQTRAVTTPDGEGWLTAGPLPAADEGRPVHAVVTVDGRTVREDTLTPYSCGSK